MLRRDERGSAVVEFAIIAPVMCLSLVGAFDVAHTLYMQSVLQGIVQKVGRDSALEGNDASAAQTALDNKVRAQARALANNATVTITRRSYKSFSKAAAAQAEAFTDTNGNGRCDGPNGGTPGEIYIDANNNSQWDSDGGFDGQGGAKDAVVYTVAITYNRMFPLYRFVGVGNTTTVTAATTLANQPYDDQASYGTPTTRNCT